MRGAGCVGDQEKEWMKCLLDDLRAFGIINADLWTTAAQDEGEWHKTAEQGAERFMAKLITAEKVRAGIRRQHAVVCPNVTRRIKDMIAQSKRFRALAKVDQPQMARAYILQKFCLFKEKSERTYTF